MSARVVETVTGAQVLPRVIDARASVNSWEAHCVMDADLRAKSKAHRTLATQLHIEEVDE